MDNMETNESRIDLSGVKAKFDEIRAEIKKVIVGQDDMIDLLLVALLSNGHVLIEGNPGLAKTLTAKLLARTISAEFKRIQFTPDLMPSDILGTSVFNFQNSTFEFKFGPIFSNIILIDEINRSPAKTQSALFEVMEERQVSIDSHEYQMKVPFIIIATQNPIDMEGTYQLPEAQMDRFLFKIPVTYPNMEDEVAILERHHENTSLLTADNIKSVINVSQLKNNRKLLDHVIVDQNLIRFIAEIVQTTRKHKDIDIGASPRASLSLLNAGKAHAVLLGRDYVIPDDILRLAPYVLNHRITLTPEKEMEGATAQKVIEQMLKGLVIPR